jgi:hypothetical protein
MGERAARHPKRPGRRSSWNLSQRAVMHELARRLVAATSLAFAARSHVRQNRTLRLLVAEAAGLLDALTGLDITNPDERARHHMQAVRRLARQLHPAIPGRDSGTTGSPRGSTPASRSGSRRDRDG